jgi:3-methyladenine DNA glycosylase AlkD
MRTLIGAKLRALGDPRKAEDLQRFFKTGTGEYGEGDVFLGIRVPVLRKLATEYRDLTLGQAKKLLRSAIHEERLLALFILIDIFAKGSDVAKRQIYHLYLEHTQFVNNWDLVDASAEHIVGAYLWDKDKAPLLELAGSSLLWERRIAILSTFHFIKRGEFEATLKIARLLLADSEDLIHKAVGWMLREVGKRNLATEEAFLGKHYRKMPRTMLRYAIERFPEEKRRAYLHG